MEEAEAKHKSILEEIEDKKEDIPIIERTRNLSQEEKNQKIAKLKKEIEKLESKALDAELDADYWQDKYKAAVDRVAKEFGYY